MLPTWWDFEFLFKLIIHTHKCTQTQRERERMYIHAYTTVLWPKVKALGLFLLYFFICNWYVIRWIHSLYILSFNILVDFMIIISLRFMLIHTSHLFCRKSYTWKCNVQLWHTFAWSSQWKTYTSKSCKSSFDMYVLVKKVSTLW